MTEMRTSAKKKAKELAMYLRVVTASLVLGQC